ncbi:hypothetical protein GCM10023165_09690 [Variovorax defluvii]|uniref:Uncharacterized protein n=1 Tax=Variovorax defluvii TaxID=913761 RepID=A0ABP8H453_9BURK
MTGPQKGVLEFGDYGPGCTSLPTELLEALNSAANGENTPISTVILPPGLTTMPPWLNALPIKHLVVPKFAGEYLDLGSQLPSGARIELDAPLKANIKVFVCDPETIQVEIRPQSTGLMDIQNKV